MDYSSIPSNEARRGAAAIVNSRKPLQRNLSCIRKAKSRLSKPLQQPTWNDRFFIIDDNDRVTRTFSSLRKANSCPNETKRNPARKCKHIRDERLTESLNEDDKNFGLVLMSSEEELLNETKIVYQDIETFLYLSTNRNREMYNVHLESVVEYIIEHVLLEITHDVVEQGFLASCHEILQLL